MAYSTIIPKKKDCVSCGRKDYIFSKGMCKQCATVNSFHNRLAKVTEQEEGIVELEDRLWDLVSKWVRYSAANEFGMVNCYTCNAYIKPVDCDAGHYVTRGCKYLKFDLRHIKPQCGTCNRAKGGMAREFGKHLEQEHSGITEILLEESRIVHSWSREELRGMIYDFTQKVKSLKI